MRSEKHLWVLMYVGTEENVLHRERMLVGATGLKMVQQWQFGISIVDITITSVVVTILREFATQVGRWK